MVSKLDNFIIFLTFFILNFAALGLGGLFTTSGINSEWFSSLEQAPWNPSGWMFGVAWTTIMICFTIYMTSVYLTLKSKSKLLLLFAIQWLLNVGWNVVFFYFHSPFLGFVIISILLITLILFLRFYQKKVKYKTLFLMPYIVWLMIATSLNVYILLKN